MLLCSNCFPAPQVQFGNTGTHKTGLHIFYYLNSLFLLSGRKPFTGAIKEDSYRSNKAIIKEIIRQGRHYPFQGKVGTACCKAGWEMREFICQCPDELLGLFRASRFLCCLVKKSNPQIKVWDSLNSAQFQITLRYSWQFCYTVSQKSSRSVCHSRDINKLLNSRVPNCRQNAMLMSS